MVLEGTLVCCRSFLVLALVPRTVLECAIEPALTSSLEIFNLTLSHVASLKETIIDRFTVGEVQDTLSMSLVHLVDLTVICCTIAIADVLCWQARELVSCGCLGGARALLAGSR